MVNFWIFDRNIFFVKIRFFLSEKVDGNLRKNIFFCLFLRFKYFYKYKKGYDRFFFFDLIVLFVYMVFNLFLKIIISDYKCRLFVIIYWFLLFIFYKVF